jgi:hypothetical protein
MGSELKSSAVSNSPEASLVIRRQATCPTCHASVCMKCRSLMHDGDCPDSDPALESYLKEWKVKQCPKCRSGVHKGHGCALIQCRCGANFCFHCLRPSCNGQCIAKQTSTSSSQSRENRNKLADRTDRHGSDIIPPREIRLEAILKYAGCEHDFHHAQIHTDSQANASHKCIICTRNIKLADTPGSNINKAMDDEVAWECRCGMIVCGKCKDAYTEVFVSKLRLPAP